MAGYGGANIIDTLRLISEGTMKAMNNEHVIWGFTKMRYVTIRR